MDEGIYCLPSIASLSLPPPAAGKDVFEAFSKKDLAKRVLFGTITVFDAETPMLLKII